MTTDPISGSSSAKTPTKDGESEENDQEKGTDNVETSKQQNEEEVSKMSASALFNSALGSFGLTSSGKEDKKDASETESKQENTDADEQRDKNAANPAGFGLPGGLSNAWSTLSKVAEDATHTIKEKVGTKNMLSEFNKEQENFIRTKGTVFH